MSTRGCVNDYREISYRPHLSDAVTDVLPLIPMLRWNCRALPS